MTQTPTPPTPADTLELPVVPMRNYVLFPQVLSPITVGRPKSVASLEKALAGDQRVVLALQRQADQDDPTLDDLYTVGTLARLMHRQEGNHGQVHVVCLGVERVRLLRQVADDETFSALVALAPTPQLPSAPGQAAEWEALGLQLRELGVEILSLLPSAPGELAQLFEASMSPGHLSDVLSHLLDVPPAEKQALLEMDDELARAHQVLRLATHRLQVLRLQRELGERTREHLDDRQRRVLLQEQLRTIKHELGENGEVAAETARLREKIDSLPLPPEVAESARKELKRLTTLPEGSSENALVRTWLEVLSELPWGLAERAPVDLRAAQDLLAQEHHGLDKVKRRILEFLAVRQLNPTGRAPILCLAGPPGVGKTTLARSIARALDRPLARVSLGGVHDEADIRGHRRTYVGALPGRILQALRQAGARDAVVLLDEVDKLGSSLRGDPAAALLEVLDPEQNSSFRDHYLDQPFDLSQVIFVATANVMDAIHPALQDRLEVLNLPGYTQEEKLEIAQRFLLPRQREACGLNPDALDLPPPTLMMLIERFTREAGVRQLEREIARVCRHAALRKAQGETSPLRVLPEDLEALLGPAPFELEGALMQGLPGVATGLAWTPAGGDLLFIEATRVPGKNQLILTGQLGDVMKESAQAAWTLVRTQAAALGIPSSAFEQVDIHLHVPAGAIPKDGPSAGLAMFLALASLLAQRSVRPDVAVTGEISLRGRVLPVGGIKEKVLAAQRAGVRTVVLPQRNLKDLVDVPESTRQALTFLGVDRVDQALAVTLLDRRGVVQNGGSHPALDDAEHAPSPDPATLGRLGTQPSMALMRLR